MGFAEVLSRAQFGMAAPLVRVEVHLGSGLPCFNLVGLPAPVVKESRERVRAALAHCGFELPAGRITVNLSPADLPKEGGRFDLPIALGILLASGQLQTGLDLATTEFYGELALTGELKPVPGLLSAALEAGRAGHALVVPRSGGADIAAATSGPVFGAAHLQDLAAAALPVLQAAAAAPAVSAAPEGGDLADVRGQWQAKRALLIAAAGNHSLLLEGPPGSGKTMLAQRLPALLPPLTPAEALEVAAIAAVSQCLPGAMQCSGPRSSLVPPFRAPHHTASAHAIVGGGKVVQPGEISLAHHGVLFLDELPEFDRRVLEALREPLESGRVSVVRANQRVDYPASFLLVAAMNPCPCGCAGLVRPKCRCLPSQVQRYRARVSGPLLDRIDLRLRMPPVDAGELARATSPANSDAQLTTAQARIRVRAARHRQLARQGLLNARLGATQTLEHCRGNAAAMQLLRRAAAERGSSARSQHRVLRVARSIADLEDSGPITDTHVAEALALHRDD